MAGSLKEQFELFSHRLGKDIPLWKDSMHFTTNHIVGTGSNSTIEGVFNNS